jgi:hypothetical protein
MPPKDQGQQQFAPVQIEARHLVEIEFPSFLSVNEYQSVIVEHGLTALIAGAAEVYASQ